MKRLRPWLLATLCAAIAAPAAADDIKGVVSGADGKPVIGAEVVIDDLLVGTTSGATGAYHIRGVPTGSYVVSVRAPLIASQSRSVTVTSDGAARLDFKVGPNVTLERLAAAYHAPPLEHLAMKKAYLQDIKPAQAKAPNILMIVFDDLGAGDLLSFGNRLIKTPNIDSVAARGMRLTSGHLEQ